MEAIFSLMWEVRASLFLKGVIEGKGDLVDDVNLEQLGSRKKG